MKHMSLALLLGAALGVTASANHHEKEEAHNHPAPAAGMPRTASPEGAVAYIVSPADGATVSSPVTVVFGLKGMGVAPAGIIMDKTGHHHLLINTESSKIDPTMPLPATDQIKHFGGGQTETTLELPPGTHTLQLLLGDHMHVPHTPAVVSKKITITVK